MVFYINFSALYLGSHDNDPVIIGGLEIGADLYLGNGQHLKAGKG